MFVKKIWLSVYFVLIGVVTISCGSGEAQVAQELSDASIATIVAGTLEAHVTNTPLPSPTLQPPTETPVLPTIAPFTHAPLSPTIAPFTQTPVLPTLTPSPTGIPNTVSGTVLELGEAWFMDGIELRMTKTIFDPVGLNIGHSCYIIRLEMMNGSEAPIYFVLDKNEFWVTDNLGRRYEMERKFNNNEFCSVEGYDSPRDVSIKAGQRFSYNWLEDGWNMQFYIPVTDPSIEYLNFHLGRVERITNAEWYIPLR